MARKEEEREDLLRDATALVERIELAPASGDSDEHVVIGFRADGAASFYFGSDPVYHFNSRGQLRRAYCGGLLFKANRCRLISMRRVRRNDEVQLLWHELSDEEQANFIADMSKKLRVLADHCRAGDIVTVGQVPADVDVLGRVTNWLGQYETFDIAASPHAR